jgi:DNA-binding response OmpR family regulator
MRGPIMIVESDEPTARWLHEVLVDLGYPLDVAPSGHAALMLASSIRPDVVVMDVDLSDGSGIEVLSDLQIIDKSVPVIMLCPTRDPDAAEAALRAGAVACLRKPIGASALLRAMTLALAVTRPPARMTAVGAATGKGATSATPFDASPQICPGCRTPITDVGRAVVWERGVYHPVCWLQHRRRGASSG